MIAYDEAFDEQLQLGDILFDNAARSQGIFITLVDPAGNNVTITTQPIAICAFSPNDFNEGNYTVGAISKIVRNRGLPMDSIRKFLTGSDDYESPDRTEEAAMARKWKRLEPGQSVMTPPWIDKRDNRDPLPKPIKNFAELSGFNLTSPGLYRIRAVYDARPTGKMGRREREKYLRETPWAIRVVTPEIAIQVQ